MPYRNEVQPLNLFGDYLAGKQAAISQQSMQQQNALRGLEVQQGQRVNALADNPQATPEQYARAGAPQTGMALQSMNQQGQIDKQQAMQQLVGIAQKALSIAPEQRKAFLQQAGQIYGPAFQALGADMSQFPQMLAMPDADLDQKLKQVAQFAPAQKPIEVAKGGSLVVPDNAGGYRAAYTSPAGGEGESGFTLSPEAIRFDAQGREIARGAPKSEKLTRPEGFDIAAKLRGEYNKQAQEFTGVADAYQRIKDSAADPSAAGDLSLIFNYMKVLDPGSTVREGEFATAQNAGGAWDRVGAMYNRILKGERLAANQRADFVGRATKLYQGQEDRFNTRVKQRYEGLSRRYGLDPAEVLSDPNTATSAGPQVGAVDGGYRFNGGNPADPKSWSKVP